MQITSAALTGLNVGFKALFSKAFETAAPRWDKIATLSPSETSEEVYPWLGALPGMREWVGDRIIKALATEGYRIVNKPFEMTVSVKRDAIEDDRYGIYAPLFSRLGESAALWPDDLVFALLKKGDTEKCYDGTAFFNAAHPIKKGVTASNLGTKKLSAESYAAARASMMSLVNEENKSLKIMPDRLVVPPQLESLALKLIKAETIEGTTNTMANTATVEVVPDLSDDANAWYLMATGGVIKPLIFQQRKKPEMVTLNRPTDENAFMRAEYLYGADARGAAGFGLWQCAYKSTGAEA